MRAVGAAGLAGVSGLAGCLGGGGGGGTLTIGLLNPMSGAYAALGEEGRQGAQLAIQQANESGDYDFEIEPVTADTEGDSTTATQRAEQLVERDGATVVYGAVSSSVAIALNAFAADNEVVYFPGAAAVSITGAECNEWVFRDETNTAMIAESAAGWTLENLGSDVWFHIADYAYGDSVLAEFRARMEAAEAEFNEVGVSRAQLGAQNFEPYVSEMAGSDADVAVIGATGGDLVNFINQADGQGLQDSMDVMTTTGSFAVVRAGTDDSATGIYSGTRYVPTIDTGDNPEFVSAYEDEYGAPPDNFARVGYDSVRRGLAAAGEGGTESASIRDALPETPRTSVFGENVYRGCDHQAVNPTWVGRMVSGDGDVPGVELLSKTEGDAAIPDCSEVACDL